MILHNDSNKFDIYFYRYFLHLELICDVPVYNFRVINLQFATNIERRKEEVRYYIKT